MKKKIAKFLKKISTNLDPQYYPIRNYDTYRAVCYPYGNTIGIDTDKMIAEISRRTGIDEDICRTVYLTEDDILYEVGIMD